MGTIVAGQGNHGKMQYTIYGGDIQFVETTLPPGDAMVSESGAMMYMDQGMQMQGMVGDGSQRNSGLLGSIIGLTKRKFMGENLFITRFMNKGTVPHKIAFSPAHQGVIIPIKLQECGGTVMCQKGAFLCATMGTEINIGFTKRLGAGFFGGEGFILQKLEGDGIAFVTAGGSIKEMSLMPNEKLYVDTGSLVAFQSSVTFDIKAILGIRNLMFSGEDLFLTEMTGPGKVWIQSLPYSRMVSYLHKSLQRVKRNK